MEIYLCVFVLSFYRFSDNADCSEENVNEH